MEQARRIFSDWQPSGFDPHAKYPVPDFQPMEKSTRFVITDENTDEPILLYAWQGPDTRTDRISVVASEIFFEMLSLQNFDFHQKLIESGLAFEIEGGSTQSKYVSSMYLGIYPNPKKIAKVVELVEEEISLWGTPGHFSEDQLEMAKKALISNEYYNQEELSEYIHAISYRWTSGGLDSIANYLKYLRNISMNDITKFINKYLKQKPNAAGIITSPNPGGKIKSLGWPIEN